LQLSFNTCHPLNGVPFWVLQGLETLGSPAGMGVFDLQDGGPTSLPSKSFSSFLSLLIFRREDATGDFMVFIIPSPLLWLLTIRLGG
jgi:hypothetical protein